MATKQPSKLRLTPVQYPNGGGIAASKKAQGPSAATTAAKLQTAKGKIAEIKAAHEDKFGKTDWGK